MRELMGWSLSAVHTIVQLVEKTKKKFHVQARLCKMWSLRCLSCATLCTVRISTYAGIGEGDEEGLEEDDMFEECILEGIGMQWSLSVYPLDCKSH